MRNRTGFMIVWIAASLLVHIPALAGDVVQGKCIAFDPQGKSITIEEYDTAFSREAPYGKPTGSTSRFDCSRAKIGMWPDVGDILRIAYLPEANPRVAVKVMNVTKQDLRKK